MQYANELLTIAHWRHNKHKLLFTRTSINNDDKLSNYDDCFALSLLKSVDRIRVSAMIRLMARCGIQDAKFNSIWV